MPVEEVRLWIESVTGPSWSWFAKILSANDTGATGAHQVGLYFPKEAIFRLFPSVNRPEQRNPDTTIHATFDSHAYEREVRVIWYNQDTRDETRMTRWGGGESPVQDPEATGTLTVFAFFKAGDGDTRQCRIWLCRSIEEEEVLTDVIGPVEPGASIFYGASSESEQPVGMITARDTPCWLDRSEIPASWLLTFPEAQEIVDKSADSLPSVRPREPDVRLLKRRDCEFQLFSSVEETVVLPRVEEGFTTVDLFVAFANTVLNRRKSRSGRSLELQARRIFIEESLPHSHGKISEGRKKPDFLFPSVEDYRDSSFPAERLRMLGAKTTCKDRWRQILTEADRIERKHLLTVQEGVSVHQFREMEARDVVLVVPAPLHSKYPCSIRPCLLTLMQFIREAAALGD